MLPYDHCWRSSMGAIAVASLLSLPAAAATAPTAVSTDERWEATMAVRFGAAGGAGEIGRDTNATGGEPLIARLPDGPVLALRGAFEGRFVGLALDCASLLRPIEVENDVGVDFPQHGTQPFLYALEVELYPTGRGLLTGRLRPFLAAGAGGAVISVDLDNRRRQELTHHWLWKSAAGVRWRRRPGAAGFLELRYEATRVRGDLPIADFTLRQATAGFGYEL